MKNIKVLGAEHCKTCTNLKTKIEGLISETDSTVEKITDIAQIMQYGIMSAPSVVINEDVKCTGRTPTDDELKQWLAE